MDVCAASLSHYTLCMEIWSGSNNRVYMYQWLAKKKKIKLKKCTNFEADLWPETGDFFLS